MMKLCEQIEIKRCPKCGNRPKWTMDFELYSLGAGAFIEIMCKPSFFRKAHLKVERGAADPDWAMQKAIMAWNERVVEINEVDQCEG